MSKKIILIAGPTASGKSKLAIAIAKKIKFVLPQPVGNPDSQSTDEPAVKRLKTTPMIRSYKIRMMPSKIQKIKLKTLHFVCRAYYNEAVAVIRSHLSKKTKVPAKNQLREIVFKNMVRAYS